MSNQYELCAEIEAFSLVKVIAVEFYTMSPDFQDVSFLRGAVHMECGRR
jgi:hypothetical protein